MAATASAGRRAGRRSVRAASVRIRSSGAFGRSARSRRPNSPSEDLHGNFICRFPPHSLLAAYTAARTGFLTSSGRRNQRGRTSRGLRARLGGGAFLGQVVTQAREGAMERNLDSVRALAEQLGDLPHLEVGAVAERDELAVAFAEAG